MPSSPSALLGPVHCFSEMGPELPISTLQPRCGVGKLAADIGLQGLARHSMYGYVLCGQCAPMSRHARLEGAPALRLTMICLSFISPRPMYMRTMRQCGSNPQRLILDLTSLSFSTMNSTLSYSSMDSSSFSTPGHRTAILKDTSR